MTTDNPNEQLQRLLSNSLGPSALREAEIERLLQAESAAELAEAHVERILQQARGLTRDGQRAVDPPRWQKSSHSQTTVSQVPATEIMMKRIPVNDRRSNTRGAVACLVVSALSLVGVLLVTSDESDRHQERVAVRQAEQENARQKIRREWLTAKTVSQPDTQRVAVGDTIETSPSERRRVTLPDGSVLYVNTSAFVRIASSRRVDVARGEVFVEVVPQFDAAEEREPFEVVTPSRIVTALGTKFAVDAADETTDVLVTQGSVQVSDVASPVVAGQLLTTRANALDHRLTTAPRASESLNWTRELITAAAGALVPASKYAGGAIITVDPAGQEMKLSLRKYHVDVHIEDGFARTTIDHTYFNHTSQRLEGTFHFPLPPDASLSRLAMYVNGKLMEGGMAERQHARNTFEKIVSKMKDPALLEWVDGSTFKMRVFPLEPRQEKRIVLSYTQRLASAYGKLHYRFPAGHSMDVVRDWSTAIRVRGGANVDWNSPSHELTASTDEDGLLLEAVEHNSTMDRDIVLEFMEGRGTRIEDREANTGTASWTRATHEDHDYLMLRFRPDLPATMQRPKRNWIVLFEASADRDPLLARTQIEIIRRLLDNTEHDDTFSVITANTKATLLAKKPRQCSAKHVAKAIRQLDETHLVGAFDFQKALTACDLVRSSERENVLVHVGSAIPVLGDQDQSTLLKQLPTQTAYVGVGVGRRWSQTFMKQAASQTGGYFTQINPDEEVAWRAFELSSVLNAPRLMDVRVTTRSEAPPRNAQPRGSASGPHGGVTHETQQAEPARQSVPGRSPETRLDFLNFADTIAHGEEICAVTRLAHGASLPTRVTVTGLMNGKPWQQTVRVHKIRKQADYLPRTWARLEIDRLVAEGAAENKDTIIRLSKAMYVMSPFTSLLVLENEEMYAQYNIDRGRKDHWALYGCPDEIKVVQEPFPNGVDATVKVPQTETQELLSSIQSLPQPQIVSYPQTYVVLSNGTLAAVSTTIRAEMSPRNHWYAPQQNLSYWGQPSNTWGVDAYDDYGFTAAEGAGVAGAGSLHRFTIPAPLTSFSLTNDITINGDMVLHGGWIADSDGDAIRVPGLQEWEAIRDFGSNGDRINEGIWMDLSTPQHFAFGNRFAGAMPVDPSELGLQFETGPVRYLVPDQVANDSLLSGLLPTDKFLLALPNFEMPGDVQGLNRLERLNVTDGRFMHGEDDLGDVEIKALPDLRVLLLGSEQRGVNLSVANGREFFTPVTPDQMASFQYAPFYSYRPPAAPDGEFANGTARFGWPSDSNQPLGWRQQDLRWDDGHWELDFGNTSRVDRFSRLNRELQDVSLSLAATLERESLRQVELQLLRETEVEERVVGLSDELAAIRLDLSQLNGDLSGRGLAATEALRRSGSPAVGGVNAGSVHPWSVAPGTRREAGIQLPTFGAISYPEFGNDRRFFGDLMSHAPGLNTLPADVLAVGSRESGVGSRESTRQTRDSDPMARKMIERARSLGWERVTLPGREGLTVLVNGRGQHVYERTVSEGLLEQVVCDGDKVLHVYDDIGLAAKRDFSKFHRRTIESLVPWLLPSAEELARGADVVAIDERTVAVRNKERGTESNQRRDVRLASVRELRFVFGDDGRLVERRLVEQLSGKTLLTIRFDETGPVEVINSDGDVIAIVELKRERCDAPDLTPELGDIVVLPLPIRSAEHILGSDQGTGNREQENEEFAKWSEERALALVLADSAAGNGDRVVEVIRERFFEQDDNRDGLYVLLSRFPGLLVKSEAVERTDGRIREVNLLPSPEGSPLRQFIRQWVRWQQDNSDATEFAIEGPEDGFVQRLATARNLYHRWKSGQATQDRTDAQVNVELDRVLTFVGGCRTGAMGWTLLSVVEKNLAHDRFGAEFAAAAGRFEASPVLGWLARQERCRTLLSAGRMKQARRLYGELLVQTVRSGQLPRIDAEMRALFIGEDGQQAWSELLTKLGEGLLPQGENSSLAMPRTACLLSVQLRQLGDTQAANELLDRILEQLNPQQRPDVALLAVEQLRQLGRSTADRVLSSVMKLESLQTSSALWRYAAKVADAAGNKQLALQRLERAVQLDFSSRPDVINLESLRADYADLLSRYDEIVSASATLGQAVPEDLLVRVVRVADQWRSIDDDDTACCRLVARILTKLNRDDLAWDYLTTPLAGSSRESAPWKSLAETLTEQQQVSLADIAWSRAYEFERTNPELLLSHARMLMANGQAVAGRRLLQEIVTGNWQPRFKSTVDAARNLLVP